MEREIGINYFGILEPDQSVTSTMKVLDERTSCWSFIIKHRVQTNYHLPFPSPTADVEIRASVPEQMADAMTSNEDLVLPKLGVILAALVNALMAWCRHLPGYWASCHHCGLPQQQLPGNLETGPFPFLSFFFNLWRQTFKEILNRPLAAHRDKWNRNIHNHIQQGVHPAPTINK